MHYTTRLFAKDCVGLMDALGIKKAHMMGHSMGARVLQWVALIIPRKSAAWFCPGPAQENTAISLKTTPRCSSGRGLGND